VRLVLANLVYLVVVIGLPAFGQTVVRIGAFANITHAQAMVGKNQGWFERGMGPGARVDWKIFTAGPSAIEALFAGALDITYIGPNPAITGYIRSNGEALRVVAGAAGGGAALIVRADSGIQKPADFHGKKVASPQLANTQDIALRAWLRSQNLKPREKGGDVQVLPIANADQLNLFLKKQLDAAWAPEPWATRLIHEGGGRLFLDERTLWPKGEFVTALVVVNTKFLHEHPDMVENFIRTHVALTDWINHHLPESKRALNQEIQKLTGAALADAVLDEAFSRIRVTYDPLRSSLSTSARMAYEQGFLGKANPDLSGLCDLSILDKVLKEKGRAAIR